MSRAILAVLAVLAMSGITAAQRSGSDPAISTRPKQDAPFPMHPATFENGVRAIPDLQYWAPAGYRPLTLDLYMPPASMPRPRRGFPLVVQIHGGGWMSGDKRHTGPFVDWPRVLASLAEKGYIVAAVDYRLSSEARFPVPAGDVKAAIRWLRQHASTYGIDTRRVVTWGESAGAHLAALVAVSCGVKALEPRELPNVLDMTSDVTSRRTSDCVQGGIAWFGVFDLMTIQQQAREVHALSRDDRDAPEWKLLGCFASDCAPARLAAASPVTYVDKRDPPMLLIVGNADTTVPPMQTLEMADRLTAVGVTHQLLVLPAVDHSFIGKTADATRDANLKALTATFRFIDDTIGTPH